jgi:hypothetical protein
MPERRIKVRGVRRDPLDPEAIAQVFWLMAKARLRERREQEARQRTKQKEPRDER